MIGLMTLVSVLSAAAATATVSVRVVQPTWQGLPGAEVELVAAKDCLGANDSGATQTRFTNNDGVAEFTTSDGRASYVIRASHSGGFEGQEQCVTFGSPRAGERSHVQFRLRPDPSYTVTLSEPSAGPDPDERSVGLVLLDFVGSYRTKDGRYYVVNDLLPAEGVELSLPDGRSLSFTQRDGVRFISPAGVLTFKTKRRRVVGLSFAPTKAEAERVLERQQSWPGQPSSTR